MNVLFTYNIFSNQTLSIMRARITTLLIALVAIVSTTNGTTKATQFAVIDLPFSIETLFEDGQNIYLLQNSFYTNSGVQVINKSSGELKHYPITDNVNVTDFKISKDGTIYYVITNKGLFKYDKETKISTLVWDKYRTGRSYKISFSPDNNHILLTGHHNVLLRQSDYSLVTQFDNTTTRKNIVDNEGNVWNMGVSSIDIYTPGAEKPISYISSKYNKQYKEIFEHAETIDAILAPDNNIYILVGNNIYTTPQTDHTQWKLVSTYKAESSERPHRLLSDNRGNFFITVVGTKEGFIPLGTTMPETITAENLVSSTHIKQPSNYSDRSYPVKTYNLCRVIDGDNLLFMINDNKRMIIYSPESTYKPFMGKYTLLK